MFRTKYKPQPSFEQRNKVLTTATKTRKDNENADAKMFMHEPLVSVSKLQDKYYHDVINPDTSGRRQPSETAGDHIPKRHK